MDEIITVEAEPESFKFRPSEAALIVIDMQRDFIKPGGFGESLGNDVSRLEEAIQPTQAVLKAIRAHGMDVIHTREGHRPNLSNCTPSKRERGDTPLKIGDEGPLGRLLIEGAEGQAIVDELKPKTSESVIDKPGKGAFYSTDLDLILRSNNVKHIIFAGVTTEVCVQSTVREANDRGYECLVLSDCVASYNPELHDAALEMISSQGGIFGWTANSAALLQALD